MKPHQKKLLNILIATFTVAIIGWMVIVTNYFQSSASEGHFRELQAVWQINDRCIQLAVADTPALRRQGLSGRPSLAPNEGLLFLYNIPGQYGYWMKDMNFPIDIIWLTARNRVITITANVSPDSYPRVFYPAKNASKVIEVSAGLAAKENVEIGDFLEVSAATTTPALSC